MGKGGEREGSNKRVLMHFQILTGLNNIFFKEIITVKPNANHCLVTLTNVHQSRNLERILQELHFTFM